MIAALRLGSTRWRFRHSSILLISSGSTRMSICAVLAMPKLTGFVGWTLLLKAVAALSKEVVSLADHRDDGAAARNLRNRGPLLDGDLRKHELRRHGLHR